MVKRRTSFKICTRKEFVQKIGGWNRGKILEVEDKLDAELKSAFPDRKISGKIEFCEICREEMEEVFDEDGEPFYTNSMRPTGEYDVYADAICIENGGDENNYNISFANDPAVLDVMSKFFTRLFN